MIKLGFSSSAVPQHSTKEVLALAAVRGVELVEWHAAHVPPDAVLLAHEVRDATLKRGIKTAAYDPDWRIVGPGFTTALNVAVSLNARIIRVGVGVVAFEQTTPRERAALVEEVRTACEFARRAGVVLSVKARKGSLVDSHRARLWLVRRVAHPSLRLEWTAGNAEDHEELLDDLREILPRLSVLRVTPEANLDDWRDYLGIASKGRRYAIAGPAPLNGVRPADGPLDVLKCLDAVRRVLSGPRVAAAAHSGPLATQVRQR